ncbi:hypothetical protein AB0442_42265 [Kitasatospora sp. NPDC085895]|uniref:hypothetical protein n=1 Tax=Kitasatospora sp. NPDC085895 TaxID=3155057 RepID=UPI003450CE39
MPQILRTAKRAYVPAATATARPVAAGRDKVNYASLEHAGKPHKGRTQDAEKALVRAHFDQINQRLEAEGIRTIDLTNPDHVNRYDLHILAQERGISTT